MESFIIYTSFYKPIERFTDAQLGRLFRALFLYKMGEEPEVRDDIRVAFDFFKFQLDFDGEKYRKKVEKNKEAGRLGGLARGRNRKQSKRTKQTLRNEANEANAKEQANEANAKNSKHDNDNDNDNDNERHIYESLDTVFVNKDMSSAKTDDAIAQVRKNKAIASETAKRISNYYNQQIAAKGARLVACQTMTGKRKSAVLARIKEYGIAAVKETIDKAVDSEFLNYGATNAPVNFDWIFKPNNFPKIMEGFYDKKNNPELGRVEIDNSTDKFKKWQDGWK